MENEGMVQALHTNIIIKVMENKYRKTKTASLTFTEETGQMEKELEQIIGYAEVVNCGPECKYLKEGMGIYVDTRSLRPIPFKGRQYMQVNEMNVLCYVTE
jgi:hypothetical protein